MDLGLISGVAGGVLALVLFLGIIAVLRLTIRVCPSNKILVVTGGTETVVDGRKYGFRLQKGGWTFVIPFIQSVQAVDLTIIPINVRVEGVNSANGINVGADATACVCIDDTNETLLYSAVQRLLGKDRPQIQEQIQQTMIGNFRAALNKTTPLQAIGMVESVDDIDDVELVSIADEAFKGGELTERQMEEVATLSGERAIFRRVLLEDCQEDLSTFGIDVVSVSLQRIWDTSNYIANLANKTLSRKRKEVEIEEARLQSRAERSESDAARTMQVAESGADERILEVKQDVELFRREREASVTRARLEANSQIAEAESEGQSQVERMKVELQELKNQSEVTLQAAASRESAEILAGGEAETVDIVQQARNDLLQRKVELLLSAGDIGKIALFMNQLPTLFESYSEHAKYQKVDNLLVLNEEDGFNAAVNRGPAALVDFLHQIEEGFGISVRDLMSSSTSSGKAISTNGTGVVHSSN